MPPPAAFGPMVMVGFGGVAAEVYQDVVYRPAPVTVAQAGEMIDQLKAAARLDGFRGAAQADRAALAELIVQLSSQVAMAVNHVVAEIDLNPVMVHSDGDGVSIIDALVVAALEQVAE